MNLVTQPAVKELLKSKCLVLLIHTSSNIWFKIFSLTLVIIVLRVHRTPFSRHEYRVYYRSCDIFHLSSSVAFLIKRGKIHVKHTEKLTFLILKDDSILRTALSESLITSLKFEHFSNQRTKRRSDWCEIHTLMGRSDWCKQYTTLCTLT